MSRREGRETESKRHHSKHDREPSPKRSRREGKPATERTASGNHDLNTAHRSDQDHKQRRRLQDAVPLEAPLEPESKVVPDAANRELSKKIDEPADGTKISSDPTKVPRARSYFQHDERGSAGQSGRSFGRRATTERGWWSDTKDRSSDKFGGKKMDVHDPQKRDERTRSGGEDDKVWRHDRFQELETDAPPPVRKRPAFREKKVEPEAGNAAGVKAIESGRHSRFQRPVLENARKEERDRKEEREGRHFHESNRPQKPLTKDWGPPHRGDTHRFGFPSRERFTAGAGGPRGRDRFSGRYGDRNQYRPNNVRVDKWKHDLFHEANKSPSPKNEEDKIAKVEALLAS